MAKDGLTVRPWYRWSPRDFHSDPVVVAMDREQRWRYRDALDFSWLSDTPGVASEDQWRRWLSYRPSQWPEQREAFISAFIVEGEQWTQKRLRDECIAATAKSIAAKAAQARGVDKRWPHRRDTDASRT